MQTTTSVIAGEWTLFSVAAVLVGCRLFVRLGMNKDRIHLADGFLLVGLFCSLGLAICDFSANQRGELANYDNPSVPVLKYRYATNYFFDTGMYFPKFSIIAFYYTLVPPTQPNMRIALYVLTAFTALSCLVTLGDAIFWCGLNVKSNWDPDPNACSAFNTMTMMRIHWSLNFTTEVLNLVFPFPLIRDLKLPRLREKIGLVIILGLGIITIIVGIVRFATMVNQGNSLSSYIFCSAEINVSIIVVSLTALRPLLRRITHLIYSTRTGSDNIYEYDRSSNVRTKTARSKPTFTQGSGAYWRTYSVTRTRNSDLPESGSDVELNDMRSQGIVKTEEITVVRERAEN